jgi:type IV secretory pathway VirB10-like protein
LRLTWLWVVLAILGLGSAVLWGLMRYTSVGKRFAPVISPATTEKPGWVLNGGFDKYPVEKVAPAPTPEDANAKALEEFKRQMALELAAKQREIDALKRQPKAAPASTPAPAPKEKKRAQALYVVNEQKPALPLDRDYTLPVWSYIPCVLENVLVSEIPGHFSVTTRRPVYDASGSVLLIPQGARIGAKAETGSLLLGNERIPTFALSLQRTNGEPLDLGHAPILDKAGTNGLTGDVNNHWWRLVWTSIFIEGLKAGQQVLSQEIANQGGGVTVTGVGQYSSNLVQQRLGRAQDTRPTITAFAGEPCQILTTSALKLPAAN